MTLSNASTSKLALAALGLLILGAGCAEKPSPPAPRIVYGHADLDALVRSRPGWSGLQRYDAALARLNAEGQSLPPAGRPDPKLATLPALALAAGPGTGPQQAVPIGRHLAATEAALLGTLNDRRKAARAEQVRRQQELWRRDARRRFPVPAQTAEVGTDLELQLLEANVAALTQTLLQWDNSAPPAPKLARLKRKVESDKVRLETLIAERIQTRESARAARSAAIMSARQARLDYVSAQGAALSAKLAAQDTRAVQARAASLSRERLALLAALAAPVAASVPAAGNAGAIALPRGPGSGAATLSANSLQAARKNLLAQRGRWVQYLYDDTRASALDAAGKKHWNVTLGPPRPGDRDLTADLAHALARG